MGLPTVSLGLWASAIRGSFIRISQAGDSQAPLSVTGRQAEEQRVVKGLFSGVFSPTRLYQRVSDTLASKVGFYSLIL